jgi:hypothetical protein
MLRRSLIPAEGYRDFDPAEDYDLLVRMAKLTQCELLRMPLVTYRYHQLGVSIYQNSKQELQCRRINAYQLEELGLEFDSDMVVLHRNIGLHCSLTHDELRRASSWLLGIVAANSRTLVFDEQPLRKVISDFWLIACIKSQAGLMDSCSCYFGSTLSRGFWFAHMCRLGRITWDRASWGFRTRFSRIFGSPARSP